MELTCPRCSPTPSVAMLGVQCEPADRGELSYRELLVTSARPSRRGPPPALTEAAVTMIADCDPDRCFEEGLELMLAGLAHAQSRKS